MTSKGVKEYSKDLKKDQIKRTVEEEKVQGLKSNRDRGRQSSEQRVNKADHVEMSQGADIQGRLGCPDTHCTFW